MSVLNTFFIWVFEALKTSVDLFVSDPGNQWGVTIILVTVIFNTLLLPMNVKQIKTMKKTQALQPELKKLQAKYKSDPQKLQEMQMKLYKDNNVSMFGGCLPLLLTMPLFIAMFSVFRELAAPGGALTGLGFTPVIRDFSASGNWILAILAVVTMIGSTYLSTKNNKVATDNAAANSANKMQYFMAAFFGYIVYTTNAALGLYWVVGNLYRLIQTVVINMLDPDNKK